MRLHPFLSGERAGVRLLYKPIRFELCGGEQTPARGLVNLSRQSTSEIRLIAGLIGGSGVDDVLENIAHRDLNDLVGILLDLNAGRGMFWPRSSAPWMPAQINEHRLPARSPC